MGSEVLVLGAGMVGVSSALALQQRGWQVTLVDRRAPGCETSYGNAGFIQREAVQPHAFPRSCSALWSVALGRGNEVHLHWRALPALARPLFQYWRASAAGPYAATCRAHAALIAHCLSEHQLLIEAAGASDLVRREGWLQAYHQPRAFEAAAQAAGQLSRAHGLRQLALDGPQLHALEPGLRQTLAGAIHWQDPWTVSDPGELVARYAQLFQQRGGQIVEGDANTLRAEGGGWTLHSRAGKLTARAAVLALGPWSDALLRRLDYRLPLFIKRGYHRHFQGAGQLQRPLLDSEHGVVLAPMKRGLRLTTGAEFAALDAPATPRQLQRAQVLAEQLLGLGPAVESQPWLGARPCTVDMLPVVGPAPRHPGLWFHFGHAHQGFTLGPVTARLLADQMSGEPTLVPAQPYLASRFGA
jgi:D-amino-acid dehydrogenase